MKLRKKIMTYKIILCYIKLSCVGSLIFKEMLWSCIKIIEGHLIEVVEQNSN